MAVTTSKVTYSLKPETVDRVQELATAWGVPKSEVIRRAVHDLKDSENVEVKPTPLQALKELQSYAGLTKAQAKKMNEEVSSSRLASGRKRG
jgi:predicted transcriptional regulator